VMMNSTPVCCGGAETTPAATPAKGKR
jgi:hypothetical protein